MESLSDPKLKCQSDHTWTGNEKRGPREKKRNEKRGEKRNEHTRSRNQSEITDADPTSM